MFTAFCQIYGRRRTPSARPLLLMSSSDRPTAPIIIGAVGRSLLDINRSGRADGVRRLPQIWQKVVHMGGDYTEGVCVYLR
jgi:hypothetical protein